MTPIKLTTVTLISKLLHPLAEAGVLSIPEELEIVAQLRSLAKTGKPIPVIVPKLINQAEAAEMLGISPPHFKKLDYAGSFPFKRKLLGASVRYRNTDVIEYILANDEAIS